MPLRICSAAVLLFSTIFTAWCGDMNVTLDDGREVILHDDSTFEFKGAGTLSEEEGAVSLSLGNGKTLILNADGTWQMGKGIKVKPSTTVKIKTDEVSGTGSATKQSVMQSSKAATDIAIGKIADRIKSLSNNPKVKKTDIEQCIRGVVKEQQIETELQTGGGVQASITLGRGQLDLIAACLEESLILPPADTTKK